MLPGFVLVTTLRKQLLFVFALATLCLTSESLNPPLNDVSIAQIHTCLKQILSNGLGCVVEERYLPTR